MFFLGLLGVIGVVMFGMISGGGMEPFLDILSFIFVFATTFFCEPRDE